VVIEDDSAADDSIEDVASDGDTDVDVVSGGGTSSDALDESVSLVSVLLAASVLLDVGAEEPAAGVLAVVELTQVLDVE
jgi:hypothetical protein